MAEQSTVVRGGGGVVGTAGVGTASPTTVIEMPVWQMVLVRAARVYLQSLVGFLTANATGLAAAAGVPLGEFGGALAVAATLAVAPAAMSLLQNVIEFLTRLDVNRPTLRA